MLSLCCVRGGGSRCWWWPVLGVLSCSWVEQDIHELLTGVQRPKAAFTLCSPRLRMEVAGGRSKGEGRHDLLRSSLLSHRRWWVAPGREGVGSLSQCVVGMGWQRSYTSVCLLPPHCCRHRGNTSAVGRAGDCFVPVLVSPDGDWQVQEAAAPLFPCMPWTLTSWVQHTHLCWQHSISAAQTSPAACACTLLALLDASQIPSFCHNSCWSSTTCPLIAAVSVISHAVFTCLLITATSLQ